VGLAGVSLITGFSAKSKADEVKQQCPSLRDCSPALEDEYDGAKGLALATDVLWITGAAAFATGVTLLVVRGRDADSTALTARCSPAGCAVSGRF
jgi:hypothetical protein